MNASNPVVIDAAPGQSYADITREFEAPVEAVFRAHADRELFTAWIGPRVARRRTSRTGTSAAAVATATSRRMPTATSTRSAAVFHTVRENEVIIQTFEYEGMPDEVSIDIMRFESLPGGRSRHRRPQRLPVASRCSRA